MAPPGMCAANRQTTKTTQSEYTISVKEDTEGTHHNSKVHRRCIINRDESQGKKRVNNKISAGMNGEKLKYRVVTKK